MAGKKDKLLYEQTSYLTSIRFIKSVRITQYDLAQANISILRSAGVLSQEDYIKLGSYNKTERERYVGMMMRNDPNISPMIRQSITELKKRLFEANDINGKEVIRIANDAVYILRGAPLKITQFGEYLRFVHKKTYSLFARIGKLCFFFNSEFGKIDLDVIGLGNSQMCLHRDYMLNFIGNLFYMMEFNNVSDIVDYFMDFYNRYLRRELPIQYYREFNTNSLYRVRTKSGIDYGYSDCNDVNILEIGYNAQILRELFGFITEIHEKEM